MTQQALTCQACCGALAQRMNTATPAETAREKFDLRLADGQAEAIGHAHDLLRRSAGRLPQINPVLQERVKKAMLEVRAKHPELAGKRVAVLTMHADPANGDVKDGIVFGVYATADLALAIGHGLQADYHDTWLPLVTGQLVPAELPEIEAPIQRRKTIPAKVVPVTTSEPKVLVPA